MAKKHSHRTDPAQKNSRRPPSSFWRRWFYRLLPVVLLAAIALVAYVLHLDIQIRSQFEGKRWTLPARVYARPLELYPGKVLLKKELLAELSQMDYFQQAGAKVAGSYEDRGNSLLIHTRAFSFWDGAEPQQRVEVQFSGQYVSAIDNQGDGLPRSLLRLDPVQIASIHPSHNEDRILLKLEEVPRPLVAALIAVEDRDFYNHSGVSFRSIARAMFSNVRAGHMVQGGSTLTQQLVKNYFLSNERTLSRKFNEAIMSWLLEYHYSKDEILEAYFNEIYLGQDGRRAIHGIGLASQFYFGRKPEELGVEQQALLVALLNGPSVYDPRRFPERALKRRNLVLEVMQESGLLTPNQGRQLQAQPLNVVQRPNSKVNLHPAFMDLVRRQLHRDYREDDLRTEGLSIFTTLDPLVQLSSEGAVEREVGELERWYGLPKDQLQAAAVVTDSASGEIQAIVGGRDARFAGFNRALDAERQVGSLIKPVVYLTALEHPQRYNLATLLRDEPMTVELAAGQSWSPENYEHDSHGPVPAFVALAHSYNQATLQLGMELGVDAVIATLRRLGVARPVNIYPSFLLGATEMTPIDVTQMYQSLANGGFTASLRTIRAVLDAHAQPLQRYELELRPAADPQAVYQLNAALTRVAQEGTAQRLYDRLPRELTLAGKTGTTDDLRDSWFAGFTGDRLAVVWLGRDDSLPAGFTGATGAMRIWGSLFQDIGARSLELVPPEGMSDYWVQRSNGRLSQHECPDSVQLPFVTEYVGTVAEKCQ